jgi:acetyltransferase
MPIRNLNKIFRPRSVAVIGVSATPGKVGHTVLENLLSAEFPGRIYPINPKGGEFHSLTAYKSLEEIPDSVDLAVICTPAKTVPGLIHECGRKGVGGVIILTAGFRELGPEGLALEMEIRATAQQYDGLRLVGPNCLGVISTRAKLNASFANATPSPGRVAFISQSGALCTSVLDWARQVNVGFSHFVSVGNMLDVGMDDLIDYFAEDDQTEAIIMYVESIHEPRQFVSAARAFTRSKPIIAYKAGRFAESAEAAASHTGAMAGVDAVYEAAFARAGITRVFGVAEMFDCAGLLARQSPPKGRRLAIVTNAGGPGVMATDALLAEQGSLATLSAETINKLNESLPEAWSRRNPVDVLGDATPERLKRALEIVEADGQVDAVLVVLSPQAMTDPSQCAQAVIDVSKKSPKPILAAWMGGVSMRPAIEALNQAQIPVYSTPEKAVRAFMYLVQYSRNRDTLYEVPREIPMEFSLDRQHLRIVFDTILSEGRDILSEGTSKALLEAYGIPVTRPYVARTPEDAVEYARRVGYPAVLKVYSPDITHKTDVAGVELNLASGQAVAEAFERIVQNAKTARPDARVEGVTVQKMVSLPASRELIVGAMRDPVFGAVMLVGAGGITAELYQDRALELPPLSERLARRMLMSLRSWPLLEGYRGRPGVDVERLIEVMMRLSYLVADYPEIKELDVNPLVVSADEIVALDARIVLDHQALLHPPRPYAHLAIRPYPEEFVQRRTMKNGQTIVLRPIRPEDEPMWHQLLADCSAETIHLRFRCMFRSVDHDVASRFCFIDYDREIAIVAEAEQNGERMLLGTGRLVADADHSMAEYAVLVADPWQGIGLGSMLTDYCMEICQRWGVKKVVAEVARQNTRMIRMFEHRGFKLDYESPEQEIVAEKVW